jgi:hypothetical protein
MFIILWPKTLIGVRSKMGPIIPTALIAHHAPKALLTLTNKVKALIGPVWPRGFQEVLAPRFS